MAEVHLFRQANNYHSTDLPLIKPNWCFDKSDFVSRNNVMCFVINH